MSSPDARVTPDESTCDSDPLKLDEGEERPPESPRSAATSAVVFVEERSGSSCSSTTQSDGTATSGDNVESQEAVRDGSPAKEIDLPSSPPAECSGQKTIGNWPILEILPGGFINSSFQDDEKFSKLIDIDMSEKPKIDIPTYLKIMSQAELKMFSCAVCDESFEHMKELTDHLRIHRPPAAKEDLKRKAPKVSTKNEKKTKVKALKKRKAEVAVVID